MHVRAAALLFLTLFPPSAGAADFAPPGSAHKGAVMALAVSPDGRKLLSAGEDKTLRLWDVASARQLAELDGSKHLIFAAAFSPDGNTVAAGGGDREIRLWSADGGSLGEMHSSFNGHSLPVTALAWTKDGQDVIAGSIDGTIKLWSVAQKKVVATLDGHMALVQDAETTGSMCVFVPQSCTGPICTSAHKDCKLGVMGLAVTADGNRLVSAGGDGSVKVWDLTSRRLLRAVPGDGQPVLSLAVSPDGARALAGTAGNEVRVIDVERGKVLADWPGHNDDVTALAFSPDGKQALSGSRDSTVRLWSVDKGETVHAFEGHAGEVRAVTFGADSQSVFSAGLDGAIKRWTKGGEAEVVSAQAPAGRPALEKEPAKPAAAVAAPTTVSSAPAEQNPAPKPRKAPIFVKAPAFAALPAPAAAPAPKPIETPAAAPTTASSVPPAEPPAPAAKAEEDWWAVPEEEGAPAKTPKPVAAKPAPPPAAPPPAPKPASAPEAAAAAQAPAAQRGPFDPHAKPASPSAQVALSGGIVAGAKATLKVTVYNSGPGPAQDLKLVFSKPSMDGIVISPVQVGTIKADESAVAEVPLEAAGDVPDGHVKFVLRIEEKNGFDSKPIPLGFETHAKP